MIDHVDSPESTAGGLRCHTTQSVPLKRRKELGKSRWHTSDHLAAISVLGQQQREIERGLLLEADLAAVGLSQCIRHAFCHLHASFMSARSLDAYLAINSLALRGQ